MAVLGMSMLISYERAKAESLSIDAKGGLMERAERIIALCLALLVRPLMVPILFVMLALTLVTAVQRFVKVWRQAAAPPRRVRARDTRAMWPRRLEGRWEARRARRLESGQERRRRRGTARTRP
jgi:CDP-diacylglycerol--glycerol-3-phosphate 3-phosphatidyltransferase